MNYHEGHYGESRKRPPGGGGTGVLMGVDLTQLLFLFFAVLIVFDVYRRRGSE